MIGYGLRHHGYQSFAVVTIGLSHFLFPKIFDRVNRLGFPEQPRRFTYLNGAIETTIGLLGAFGRDRRPLAAASVCYLIYLSYNLIRTQTATRKRYTSGKSASR
ncbi:membrane protein [Mycobacterium lentiflavum]|uniref:Membrane protein n=1 Tax=Mycobacterium lentiflavum TaxID=141349 RepID=A0A0E4H211_MYCLN|nr:membrane protein [Mycobacterium lentiflavum]